MSLIRYQTPEMESWTPFNRLSSLHDELNRLFDFSLPRRDTGLFSGWSPTLDVYDTKDHFFVKMELPGMKKEDIGITLQDGVLTVSGERKSDVEHKEGETFRSERYFGKFQRSVSMPAPVNPDGVTATYKDGILTIQVAKADEAKPRQIKVNVA